MRIQALIRNQLRHMQHDRAWSTRILGGFKAVLGAAKVLTGTLKSALTGLRIAVALATEVPAATGPVVDFIEHEVSQLSTSDIAYLYRIRGEFSK